MHTTGDLTVRVCSRFQSIQVTVLIKFQENRKIYKKVRADNQAIKTIVPRRQMVSNRASEKFQLARICEPGRDLASASCALSGCLINFDVVLRLP